MFIKIVPTKNEIIREIEVFQESRGGTWAKIIGNS
jgi:hypothetical protein